MKIYLVYNQFGQWSESYIEFVAAYKDEESARIAKEDEVIFWNVDEEEENLWMKLMEEYLDEDSEDDEIEWVCKKYPQYSPVFIKRLANAVNSDYNSTIITKIDYYE